MKNEEKVLREREGGKELVRDTRASEEKIESFDRKNWRSNRRTGERDAAVSTQSGDGDEEKQQ